MFYGYINCCTMTFWLVIMSPSKWRRSSFGGWLESAGVWILRRLASLLASFSAARAAATASATACGLRNPSGRELREELVRTFSLAFTAPTVNVLLAMIDNDLLGGEHVAKN
ncbi:hypothetical protein F444_21637 [Phytophthora nicotianae P1976]|uniref:Uncharacterized protein n=1 Tax=Phytophthora nicotianae P1976 TaxID=1317066 RepID=A0A080Z0H2_PHYNI|nr:hypothetical protein F444_21637 [Phytophthora nicotianae P1976]